MKEGSGWRWLPLTVALIALDQITKWLIVQHFAYGERLNLLPVLDLTLAYNTGAAWSFLDSGSGWQRWLFTGLAIVVSVVLVLWLKRLRSRSQGLLACAVSMILAGALGNVIDRLRLGHVIDFVMVYWDEHMFPIFNVADSAISVGAAFLLLDAFLEMRRSKVQSPASR